MSLSTLVGNHDAAIAGKMFMAMTTTASAIPVNNTTAPTFLLWNKAGSGVNLVLVRYAAGWAATTEAPGNIDFNFLLAAGAAIGTGAPLTAFTALTGNCTKIGAGQVPIGAAGSAATLTTAGTTMMTPGMSHLTTTGTATFGSFVYDYMFYDTIVLTPGTIWYPTASTATASTYNQSVVWYEEAYS